MYQKKILIIFITLALLCLANSGCTNTEDKNQEALAFENALYVSVSGSDENPGTLEKPFRTIQKGLDIAQPGYTVYVRGGTYNEAIVLRGIGTKDKKIILMAYPGEHPIIDGEYEIPKSEEEYTGKKTGIVYNYNPLVLIEGQYNIIDGFEVKRSRGRGIQLWNKINGNSRYNIVKNCNVHDCNKSGIIGVQAVKFAIIDCKIWNTNIFAPYSRSGLEENWGAGLTCIRSEDVIFRGCEVYNNWGEGVGPYLSKRITIEDCTIYDNYAVNLYICNSQYVTADGNLVYHSGDSTYFRGGSPCGGIILADEAGTPLYDDPKTFGHHRKIINNLVMGHSQNFAFWGSPGNGLINDLIAGNTFINSNATNPRGTTANVAIGMNLDNVDTRIENNIIIQDVPGRLIVMKNSKPGITFRNNYWSEKPELEEKHKYILSEDDIYGGLTLQKTGDTSPGKLTYEYFMPADISFLSGKGADNTEDVQTDYLGNIRNNPPSIGSFE